MIRFIGALFLGLLAIGCGSSDEETSETKQGTAKLSFSVTNGVKVNPNLTDPLQGNIYGALFLADDVALTGPKEGAEDKASVEVLGVDLEAADVSAQTWTSPALPPGVYIFLGFMDLDDNGAETREPDVGDPVTLPINEFEIKADEEVPVQIAFDLVFG